METKLEANFIIERHPDGSISVSGNSAEHEFHWDLGKAPSPIFALSACVSHSLFQWWDKYDEFLPACRAELKLTSN